MSTITVLGDDFHARVPTGTSITRKSVDACVRSVYGPRAHTRPEYDDPTLSAYQVVVRTTRDARDIHKVLGRVRVDEQ